MEQRVPAADQRRSPYPLTLPLLIDCDVCIARGPACGDCMVTVILGPPPELGYEGDDVQALLALADGGLIPPLRMVRPTSTLEPPLP